MLSSKPSGSVSDTGFRGQHFQHQFPSPHHDFDARTDTKARLRQPTTPQTQRGDKRRLDLGVWLARVRSAGYVQLTVERRRFRASSIVVASKGCGQNPVKRSSKKF
jgi:hypothetical protein